MTTYRNWTEHDYAMALDRMRQLVAKPRKASMEKTELHFLSQATAMYAQRKRKIATAAKPEELFK
jgi:hypothetical protein